MTAARFPSLLQRFFTDRLLGQLSASPHTVAGYRDTFRLLLRFATDQLGRAPSNLRLEELDAPFIGAFLDHLEHERSNSVRTRNTRLAALHAFFRYVALNEPAFALHCQRVLAIPSKRYERGPVEFLSGNSALTRKRRSRAPADAGRSLRINRSSGDFLCMGFEALLELPRG